LLAALAALLLLGACTTAPKNPEQLVYATYASYIAASDATANALAMGSIDADQAAAIEQQLAALRPQLDTARALVGAGQQPPQGTLAHVRHAQRILFNIQQQLEARLE